MRIAQISTCHERTPPTGYGSINRIVADLTEQLVARGHEVTLFATGDSHTSARLRYLFDEPSPSFVDVGRDWLHSVFSVSSGEYFDVVHNHNLYSGMALGRFALAGVFLTTAHFFEEDERAFFRYLPQQKVVVLSEAQGARMADLAPVAVIPPGLDVERYDFRAEKNDYVLVLGQVAPHKGVARVIDAARRAGHPVRIAGPVPPEARAYFRAEIRPRLGADVTYCGEVGGQVRMDLLSHARSLVLASDVEETFGLVLIEAMACGTPVVGTRRGAIPEVISNATTGFVVDSDDELVDALRSCYRISPRTCRSYVSTKYSLSQMVDAYLDLYVKLSAD